MLGALAKRGLFPASKELNAPRETYNAKGNIVLEEVYRHSITNRCLHCPHI